MNSRCMVKEETMSACTCVPRTGIHAVEGTRDEGPEKKKESKNEEP